MNNTRMILAIVAAVFAAVICNSSSCLTGSSSSCNTSIRNQLRRWKCNYHIEEQREVYFTSGFVTLVLINQSVTPHWRALVSSHIYDYRTNYNAI